jgi:hypothetical protein
MSSPTKPTNPPNPNIIFTVVEGTNKNSISALEGGAITKAIEDKLAHLRKQAKRLR